MILGQVQLIIGLFIEKEKKKAQGPFITNITLFTWKKCRHTFALQDHVALRLLNDSGPPC